MGVGQALARQEEKAHEPTPRTDPPHSAHPGSGEPQAKITLACGSHGAGKCAQRLCIQAAPAALPTPATLHSSRGIEIQP